ncbi:MULTISPECIES: DUF2442 domain-containing protein [Xanthomonas]|uniref:DUF2442 domain-containing protein n=1 Tax=Xanthomonas cucurbitae TaxID=56453 RepID=A0A2S7DV20_9XANT|nr:DUF2442 domain-containing protein [Xanthomonas cucurbitae]PPU77631.1 hypothetical protein XcuCFBP2542_05235 [Xanthomonas cucurbitae]QHG88116.1 DUF2442 domain-containing protein [Xanthomonas cucurbitae]WDM66977.1 DUF2442 domain-containing protein [Xanthomonas cucurbitae]WDM70854.1 DUF2442 domain-containing protein [Xanthomonas cucurbitae]WDM74680.1 DUF2442 domain-containing protein [Xanthomonas cucurbitae]
MNQPQFFMTRATLAGRARLALSFADGFAAEVDLSNVIDAHPTLALLADPDVFAQVGLDEWSRGVTFAGNDALTLASDNLRAMAIEQAGHFSHSQVIAWMESHHLTLDQAADALGLSRRMLAYYRSGEKLIPKTVGLAMIGWELIDRTGSGRANEALAYAQVA